MTSFDKNQASRSIVKSCVESFAVGSAARYEGELGNPDGTINMKIHNVFIAALGDEIKYYTALVRSLDRSLGSMLEKMAINTASLNYKASRHVEGPLLPQQVGFIADLLERYKSRRQKPSVVDYEALRNLASVEGAVHQRHESDYFLIDNTTGNHHLVELKIGGDLDNKNRDRRRKRFSNSMRS